MGQAQPIGDARWESRFVDPPESAHPWVYWMWMDGNLSREGMTADLESMKRAGIAGAIIMEVNNGIPVGPVQFMSPEWRQLFKHAVREAERLGLQITLNAGPGWTGSGGPWVKPEQSMQHLVASEVEVAGPRRFSEVLPRPKRRPAFFGDGALPPELEKAKNDFYRDVVVLAFPTPTGQHRLENIDEKALYVRAPYSSQPNVSSCLPAPADFPELPPGAAIESARILTLSDRLTPDGRLEWDVPEGRWTILRFGRTTTGANTRPAPGAGLGLECDKLDRSALDAHFEAFVGALLRELGPGRDPKAGWTSLHIDSWEMGAQNWTLSFPEEFRHRRGYDLWRYLPAVTGRVVERVEISERFLWDLRQTVQELIVENHADYLKELGRRHGLGLSIEPYDMTPCANMTLGAVADVPMCEFWLYGFDTSYSVIEAASIAHTQGRRVVAAEAFTSDGAEAWRAHPASMKALGDWAFCAGVNRIVFHRFQHQPWLDHRPGMTMGPHGVHWERTQTWWDLVPAYHTYLARAQFLLRQGRSVADICYLSAEGAPQVFRPPPSATRGNPPDRRGYNFDGCTPETLLTRMTVREGKLVLPMSLEEAGQREEAASYHVLVLPARETMTPPLLRKIRELVREGATVVGSPPQKSPSLSGYPQCDAEVRQWAAELWGDRDGRESQEHAFGNGRVVWPGSAGIDPGFMGGESDALREAQWIWYPEGSPAASAPVGKRHFHRVFALETNRPAASAQVWMTADNRFELWINGHPIGQGNDFKEVYRFDVTSWLKPGENRISVAAENGGESPNPAGLVGAVVVAFRDGQTFRLRTDREWKTSRVAGEQGTNHFQEATSWSQAMELGPFGMPPWDKSKRTIPEPAPYGDFAVVADLLGQMGVLQDFESDASLRYTHRRTGKADIYFVANPEDRRVSARCLFRVIGRQPELWDAVTGEMRDWPHFEMGDERTSVSMRFEPHQSFFVLFRKPVLETNREVGPVPDSVKAGDLDGPWEVAFDPRWGGPEKVTFVKLEDWSLRLEEGIKYYSGTAIYRRTFDRPLAPGRGRWFLDLGVVKNLARVRLNGRDLGVLWCAPWRVDITDALKAKGNHLEITVANLWPNRLIGDEQLPPDCAYGSGGNLARWPEWLGQGQPRPSRGRYTFTTWKHYGKDTPLLPSGLVGPVTLHTLE